MDRRSYLAVAGAAALAGCFGSPEATVPTNESPTGATDDNSPHSESVETTADATRIGDALVETVVSDLEVPWGAAWRDGDLYLTERPGRLVRVPGGRGNAEPITTDFPNLDPSGEGGLLGLAFHPDQPVAYTYGTYRVGGTLQNRILRHDVEAGWDHEILLDGIPAASIHDGGRLFVRDDALFATTGDASDGADAQDRDSLAGKVLRFTLDGESHPGNPFDSPVFSYGHRNPQGLALRDGQLYASEHGPASDDELNLLRAGENYGWPVVQGDSGDDEYANPVASWTPTIAPAGLGRGRRGRWDGDLFLPALAGTHLRRVVLDGPESVASQDRLLDGAFGRLRTAIAGPDGHLHVTTSNRDGRGSPDEPDDRVLRLRPA